MKKLTSEDEKIAELERELAGTQEMLAFVLKAVGEPVVVTKEMLTEGLSNTTQIQVDDDVDSGAFVFSLHETVEVAE